MKIGKKSKVLKQIEEEMVRIIDRTPSNKSFLDNPRYQELDALRDRLLRIKK